MKLEYVDFIAFYLVGEDEQEWPRKDLIPYKVIALPSGVEPIDYLKGFDLSEDEEAYLFINDKPVAVKVNDFALDEIDADMAFNGSLGWS